VRSLPDGVAQALAEYLENSDQGIRDTGEEGGQEFGGNGFNLLGEFAHTTSHESVPPADHYGHKIGDLCPECGQAAVVNEEGCRKCYACGFSEC
jgi:ribonucleoside-diphosphate reductase alpha chain